MHSPCSLQSRQTLASKSMKELIFHIQVSVGLMQVLVTLNVSAILRLCLLSSDSIWLGKNDPSGFHGYADDQIESTTQLNWSIALKVTINIAGYTISKEKSPLWRLRMTFKSVYDNITVTDWIPRSMGL